MTEGGDNPFKSSFFSQMPGCGGRSLYPWKISVKQLVWTKAVTNTPKPHLFSDGKLDNIMFKP